MSRYVTDTHALVWHLFQSQQLSSQVKTIFKNADAGTNQIVIPAMTLVEIIYLSERKRIDQNAVQNLLNLLNTGHDNYIIAPLDVGITLDLQKVDRTTIPEMPDRIIAATALHLGLPLLTRDHKIQAANNIITIW